MCYELKHRRTVQYLMPLVRNGHVTDVHTGASQKRKKWPCTKRCTKASHDSFVARHLPALRPNATRQIHSHGRRCRKSPVSRGTALPVCQHLLCGSWIVRSRPSMRTNSSCSRRAIMSMLALMPSSLSTEPVSTAWNACRTWIWARSRVVISSA